jgi:hypothetical protein
MKLGGSSTQLQEILFEKQNLAILCATWLVSLEQALKLTEPMDGIKSMHSAYIAGDWFHHLDSPLHASIVSVE